MSAQDLKKVQLAEDLKKVQLAELRRNVEYVLQPSAFPEWMKTPLPIFAGLTATEMIEAGRMQDLLVYTRSYRDTSFS